MDSDILKSVSTNNISKAEFIEKRDEFKSHQIRYNGFEIPVYTGEFWTSKQRQANSLHEISYRACFKPQLPKFFIERFSNIGEIVYDPFSGRGTTIIEAALLRRNIIANDINPLSTILSKPRLFPPSIDELKARLENIPVDYSLKADIDLSMFYHTKTEAEIVSLKKYLMNKRKKDNVDEWIQMVATNRLTGHSKNFFSIYTLPPNQAVSPTVQKKINEKLKQKPIYKNVKEIILIKSKALLKNLCESDLKILQEVGNQSMFLNQNAYRTKQITSNYVRLVITSPPFLNMVQYADDNWLRCWFNNINIKKVENVLKNLSDFDGWKAMMIKVFSELNRIIKPSGFLAFEVGEIHNGKIKLDEIILPIGINSGFICKGIFINKQKFTKTSNIWGINNNKRGTNTNRILLFQKPF